MLTIIKSNNVQFHNNILLYYIKDISFIYIIKDMKNFYSKWILLSHILYKQ